MERLIWLLKPKEFLADEDNPGDPWFDKAFGFVISAETEEIARELCGFRCRL
jgi:hypothetical protein